MPVTTNTRKLAALLGASGAGIGTDGLLQAAGVDANLATQAELDASTLGVRQDLNIVALREAIGENRTTLNLPNSLVETFEDNTGMTLTDVVRDDTTEFVHTTGGGQTTITMRNSIGVASRSNMNQTGGNAQCFDGNNAAPISYSSNGNDNSNAYVIIDLGSSLAINALHLGKRRYNGDVTQIKLEYAVSNSNGTADGVVNLTNATSTVLHHDNNAAALSNFTSGGLATWAGITVGQKYSISQVLGFTSFSARYIRMSINAATYTGTGYDGNAAFNEFRTGIAVTGAATGTLISAANVVAAAKTKVSGIMLYKDNAGTATLGTHLRVYVTCNGNAGSPAWTEVLLADMTVVTPVFSTGVKMVKLAEKTCTSGTDVRYKIVWATQSDSLNTQVHGIGLNY